MSRYGVFISHGSGDTFIVQESLVPRVKQSGANVFIDDGNIDFGVNFRDRIISELQASNELLVFLTMASIQRPWVMAEIGAAIMRKIHVVAVTYGPSESELQRLGIISLLGHIKPVPLEHAPIEDYIKQLTQRVANHAQGQDHV
jgi:TIR domain